MRKITFIAVLIFVAAACNKKIVPDGHTSQNSLDWAGIYSGVIQDGQKDTKTTLIIDYDHNFELHSGGEVQKGTFKWLPDGQRITFRSGKKKINLFVGENYMTQVKDKGKIIDAGKYVLSKKDINDITDKYWKLIELYGKPINKSDETHEPHIILDSETERITGFAGCNSINGGFEINQENLRIRFLNIAATLRACDNMDMEDKLFDAINSCDNYSTDGKTLTLNRARMAPLAKFEVVYF